MVTQITLGNIAQINGRTVVNGSQSGIDTEGLIQSLTDARRLPAVRLEDVNTRLSDEKTALSSLKSLLSRYKSAVDTLRNPPGVASASQNIFEYRTTNLSTSNGIAASNYIGVTVQPGANVQSFTIDEISFLAKETKQETTSFLLPDVTSAAVTAAAAPEAGKFSAGTIELRATDGGANVSLTFSEGDSLQAVANKFNAVKDRTGIQANILKVAGGSPNNSYKIIFTGTTTGLTNAFDLGDAGTVLADADGVLAQMGFTTTQAAQNAQFKLDGVAIERESNAVDDLLDGMTFNLKQTTGGASIGIEVVPDTEIVQNAIMQMADVYNEFRLFAAKQMQLGDDGQPAEDAVLYSNATLRSIMSTIAGEVTAMVSGITGDGPNQLADIGVKFEDFAGDEENPLTRNIMVVDSEKLSSALQANFEGVRSVFEYQLRSDNPNLTTFARTNALAISEFQLTIDRANNIYQATYTDPTSGATETVDLDYAELGSGVSLTGKTGTVLAGMQLLYAAAGDATMNVGITQGIGDRLYNAIDAMLKDDGGSLTTALQGIDDQVARNQKEIDTIDEKIVSYREQLVDKYAKLEAALTQANNLLQLLDAQAQARQQSA